MRNFARRVCVWDVTRYKFCIILTRYHCSHCRVTHGAYLALVVRCVSGEMQYFTRGTIHRLRPLDTKLRSHSSSPCFSISYSGHKDLSAKWVIFVIFNTVSSFLPVSVLELVYIWLKSKPHKSRRREISMTLRWRHNGRDSVSNNQPRHCLLNRLFRRR